MTFSLLGAVEGSMNDVFEVSSSLYVKGAGYSYERGCLHMAQTDEIQKKHGEEVDNLEKDQLRERQEMEKDHLKERQGIE